MMRNWRAYLRLSGAAALGAAILLLTGCQQKPAPIYDPGLEPEDMKAVSVIQVEGETVLCKVSTDEADIAAIAAALNGVKGISGASYDESSSDGYYVRMDAAVGGDVIMTFFTNDGSVVMTGDETWDIKTNDQVDPASIYDMLDVEPVDLTGQIDTNPTLGSDNVIDDGASSVDRETGITYDANGNIIPAESNSSEDTAAGSSAEES